MFVNRRRSQTSVGNFSSHLKQQMVLRVPFRRAGTVGLVHRSHGYPSRGSVRSDRGPIAKTR
jgi:hypothetical protein